MLILSRYVAQNCHGNADRTGKDYLLIGEGLKVTLLAADSRSATVLVEGVQSEGGYAVLFLNRQTQTTIVEGVTIGLGDKHVGSGASLAIEAPRAVRVIRGELSAA